MKKKILIILGIIVACFCLTYGYYQINRKNLWKDFLTNYSESEGKSFIHNSGVSTIYTDDEIKSLDLVKQEELTFEDVKEKRDFVEALADELATKLATDNVKVKKTIENEETIVFGFTNSDGFLYIYENGTALLCIKGKYYGYYLYDLEAYQTEFADKVGNFVGSPYFQL